MPHIHQFSVSLLKAWRALGYPVGVDTWLRLRQLLRHLPPETPPEALKRMIAPVLATTPQEQAALYQLIDRLAAQMPQPKPWWQSVAMVLILGAALLTGAWAAYTWYISRPPTRTISNNIAVQLTVGDTKIRQIDNNLVAQSNENAIAIANVDTSGLDIARIGPGSSSLEMAITALKPGLDTVPLTIKLQRWSTLYEPRNASGKIEVEKTFSLIIAAAPPAPLDISTSVLPSQFPIKTYLHDSEIARLAPQRIPPFSIAHGFWDSTKTMAAAAALLLLLIWAFGLVLRRYLREKQAQEQDANTTSTPLRRKRNTHPPFTWQLRIPHLPEVELGDEANAILTHLRSRSAADYSVFDVRRTLQATIRQGGRIQLQYAQPTRPDEYLLLLDMPSQHHHQAQLFDLLYRLFADQDILIERFFYQHDPRLCWNDQFPQGISLPELQHRFSSHRLLIVGLGDRLLSPFTGELAEWTKIIEQWRVRSLLTVKPVEYWRSEEEVLSRFFRLAPATLEGLAALTTANTDDDLPEVSFWKKRTDENTAPIALDNDNSPETIWAVLEAEYMRYANRQRDERLLLWLAGCAVSPVLHWDATLFFGTWADTPATAAPLLSVDHLLQLNRLPWFSTGEMPENARRALLHWMATQRPEAYLRLRQTWKELLENNLKSLQESAENESRPPFEESAAYDKLRLTLLINELALNEISKDKLPDKTRRDLERELRERASNDFLAVEILDRADRRDAEELRKLALQKHPDPPVLPLWTFWRWQLPLWLATVLGLYLYTGGGIAPCANTTSMLHGRFYCLNNAQDSLRYWEAVFCDTSCGYEYNWIAALTTQRDSLGLNWLPAALQTQWDTLYSNGNFKDSTSRPSDATLLKLVFDLIRRNNLDSASFYRNAPIAWWNKSATLYNSGYRNAACLGFQKMAAWRGADSLFTPYERGVMQLLLRECGTPVTNPAAPATFINQCRKVAPATIALALRNRELKPAEYNIIQNNRGGTLDRRTAIADLPEGATVLLLDSTNTAYHVRYGSREGYVMARYQGKPTLLPCDGPVAVTPDWANALAANTEAAYTNYLSKAPDGPHAFEAMQKIAGFDELGLVAIRGGSFSMGCTSEQKNCNEDEKPAHRVSLSDFYIGRYEVTQAQWREIMGENPSRFQGCDLCPVESVSWDDVQLFLKKLNERYPGRNYRLPTEAEWEYAARGGDRAVLFGNGKNILSPNEANFDASADYSTAYSVTGEYRAKTTPVGTFLPNVFGLYDMSGNVYEWCSDWYAEDYYNSSPPKKPQGPANGSIRVMRGGSWSNVPQGCRVANRSYDAPGVRDFNVGFRLARTK